MIMYLSIKFRYSYIIISLYVYSIVRCTFTFSESLILEDVVYGDVWLCSGQSNMEQVVDHLYQFCQLDLYLV